MNDATGRAKGGVARAQALSPERRKEIAMRGVEAKKEKANLLKATHGSAEHPLKIGEIEIPCYVLEDETRVLSQRGLVRSLGMGSGDDRLATFIGGKSISEFVNNELTVSISNPIKFQPPSGGRPAYGYPATILADLCDAVLAARQKGKLLPQQQHIAEQCEVLVRGFARVGIIALVDEATGFQRDRAKDSLAKILEAFVAKELQPYLKTFPSDYYEQLFRLRGLPYPTEVSNFRPRYFGTLTNDIIYKRLAPGTLKELKRKNDTDDKKGKLFQRLTLDVGYQKLRDLISAVVMAMKLSKDYPDFIGKLNQFYPRYGDTLSLDLEERDKGI